MLLTIFLLCCVYWLYQMKTRSHNGIPELSGKWPLIGHLSLFLGDSCDIWNSVTKIAEESLKHGGVLSFSLGPRTFYAITDPEDCATIANECLQKDFFYDFAKPWLGEGILTADVATWKRHRKILNAAFSQQMLAGFMGVFNDQARRLVEMMAEKEGHGLFQHDEYLAVNNLETICRAALGANPEENSSMLDEYVLALEQILNVLLERFRKPWLHSNMIYNWSNIKVNETKALKVLHNLSNTILEQRKLHLAQKRRQNLNTLEEFIPFMDQILEASTKNHEYTDSQIRDEVDTIIFGGHDTSATALIYILMLIGSNENVQDKLYQELSEVLGDAGDVDKQDLSKLVYMEAVIKEALRLYPIGPVVSRYATEDVKLKKYTIPAGGSCLFFIWGIHRHEVWGADPKVFRPERWLDGTLPKNPNAFAAFSVGKRACIGKVYAMMSMKTTLAHLLRHFRISADVTKLTLKVDTFLKPESGHHISIEKRNKAGLKKLIVK